MRHVISFMLCLSALALPTAGAQSTNRIALPISGFSIAPLEPPSGTVARHPLLMKLPSTEGFEPNIHVEILSYSGTFEQYMASSEKSFQALKFEIIRRDKIGSSEVVTELSGEIQGRALYWYIRSIFTNGKVYVVTATTTESQWKDIAKTMQQCVDSFRVDSGEQVDRENAGGTRHEKP